MNAKTKTTANIIITQVGITMNLLAANKSIPILDNNPKLMVAAKYLLKAKRLAAEFLEQRKP
jgi:hypothetical protein